MNEKELEKKHYGMTVRVNTGLLITHILLLTMFAYFHVTPMVYINIFSVFLYLIMYMLYKKSVYAYVFVVYVEVLVHMSAATVVVGWDAGFQLYCICLIPCIFLCDYLGRTDKRKSMHPILVSVITTGIFVVLKIYCELNDPSYKMNNGEENYVMYIYNAIVTFVFLVVYMYIFEKRILKKEIMLADMAEVDELTQLPNRYSMKEWMNSAFDSGCNKPMAVAILDIDDFKQFNDNYGHICGDLALKNVSKCISKLTYDDSNMLQVCRWGGEEFVFMIPGENSYKQMCELMQTLRKMIAKSDFVFQKQHISMTVTIGADEYKADDKSFYDILKRADDNLYRGKASGKNQVVGKENIV